jgi:hypothetical protein
MKSEKSLYAKFPRPFDSPSALLEFYCCRQLVIGYAGEISAQWIERQDSTVLWYALSVQYLVLAERYIDVSHLSTRKEGLPYLG